MCKMEKGVLYNSNSFYKKHQIIDSGNTNCLNEMILPCNYNLFLKSRFSFADICKLESGGNIVYFSDKLEQVAEKNKKNYLYNVNQYAKNLINKILLMDVEDIIEICIEDNYLTINTGDIPQFSSFDDGTFNLIRILHRCGDFGPSFYDLGMYLTGTGKRKGAYIKYGENHSKLASLMDLVYIDYSKSPSKVFLTKLGKEMYRLEKNQFQNIISKLSIRIPIITKLLSEASIRQVFIKEELLLYLSKSTAIRRKSNIKALLRAIRSCSKKDTSLFENIY